MKKTRIQTALASLTDQEKEALAEWLRKGEYEDVQQRVNKPRADGGFGLSISLKPLRTFHAKVALLDLINSRLPENKRMTIAQFESIAAGEILLAGNLNRNLTPNPNPISESEGSRDENERCKMPNAQCSMKEPGPAPSSISSEVHDAIMNTAHDLATSGENSPADLLSLQRVADFPACAEYRAHKIALDLRKEAHKVQTDAERTAHRKEMDQHRKHMDAERLELSKRSLELREKQLALRTAEKSGDAAASKEGSHSPVSDALGLLATSYEEIRARTRAKFRLDKNDRGHETLTQNPETNSGTTAPSSDLDSRERTSPPGTKLEAGSGTQTLSNSSVHGVPSLDGQSIPLTPSIHPGEPATALTSQTVPAVSPASSSAENDKCKMPNDQCSMKISAPCSTPPAPDNREQITDNLAQRVNKYTMDRFHEAIYGKNAFAVGKYAAWKFKSKMQWCPCGKQLPCPNHGDFPPRFWEILPDDPDYAHCLERKNLPYTSPHLLMLAEKQRREEQESLKLNPTHNDK